MDHKYFFRWHGHKDIGPADDYVGDIEDLYQAFKARLIDELLVDAHGVQAYGKLVDGDQDGKLNPR